MCAVPEDLCPSFRDKALSPAQLCLVKRFVWDTGVNLVFYGLSTITVISGRLPQEVLSKLDNEKDLLAVIMDPPSTSVNISSNALFCQ